MHMIVNIPNTQHATSSTPENPVDVPGETKIPEIGTDDTFSAVVPSAYWPASSGVDALLQTGLLGSSEWTDEPESVLPQRNADVSDGPSGSAGLPGYLLQSPAAVDDDARRKWSHAGVVSDSQAAPADRIGQGEGPSTAPGADSRLAAGECSGDAFGVSLVEGGASGLVGGMISGGPAGAPAGVLVGGVAGSIIQGAKCAWEMMTEEDSTSETNGTTDTNDTTDTTDTGDTGPLGQAAPTDPNDTATTGIGRESPDVSSRNDPYTTPVQNGSTGAGGSSSVAVTPIIETLTDPVYAGRSNSNPFVPKTGSSPRRGENHA